jgi:hypothetical protein
MLYACNKTGAAVTLAAGKRTVVLPAKVGGLTYGAPVNVTSELEGLTNPQYAALEVQRAAGSVVFFWDNGIPNYETATLAVATSAAAVQNATAVNQTTVATNQNTTPTNQNTTPTNQTATATNNAARLGGHVRYQAPLAADNIYIVAAVLPAGGVQILAHQPDFPRKLNIHITVGSTTALMDIVGVGPSGEAVTESDLDVHTAGDVPTAKAYATITSITLKGVTGAGGTVGVGHGLALGLPAAQVPAASGFVVYKAGVDSANEAAGAVDAVAGTVTPTTAANGVHNYDFWYTYSATWTQAAHNHTQDAHTHVQDAHTHVQDTHNHTQNAHTHTLA